ncbi:transcription factor bHLH30 [Senna tora]|uniref:Transcription factor bHLH30 n=1 Tax=Senna tora TaxID=362788 RepID=A0A834W470_9FABA|nr:transcription factor bHLH30 [Senna tora]
MQQHHHHNSMFPELSHHQYPLLQPWPMGPAVHSFGPGARDHDPFLPPPPPPPYAALFNRRVPSLQFAYDVGSTSSDHLRILSDALGPVVQPGPGPFGLQAELGKMTAQEIMDAKALAASKSHSEAERRRRERINNHLAKLRSLLPSTTKTDKASLLAEVIQHVKELKRQTSVIAETSAVPTEGDELTVDGGADEGGRFVIKASFCCEDRSDLLPELIKTLKSLRLKTLKAEITTLGGRVKNVLFITGEDQDQDQDNQDYYNNNNNSSCCCSSNGIMDGHDHHHHDHDHHHEHHDHSQYCINSIQEALRAVMDKNGGGGGGGGGDESASGSVKRQRTNLSILQQHSSEIERQETRDVTNCTS